MDVSCKHEKRLETKNKSFNFCAKCGAVLLQNNRISAIKPDNFNYKVDVHPQIIFDNIKPIKQEPIKQNNSAYLTKRGTIIKNLRSINKKLKFKSQTLFLAVYYMDYIIQNVETLFKPELVGLCCILVAAKYDENDPIFPYVRDLQTVYPRQFFMEEDISKCEVFVLKSLGYKLDYYTSSHYLQLISLNGLMFSDDFVKEKQNEKLDKFLVQRVYEKSKEILNFMLEEETYMDIPHFYLAFCAITVSRQYYKLTTKFPLYFEQMYAITFKEFSSYYESFRNIYCQKNGIVLEKEKNSDDAKKLNRYNTLLDKPSCLSSLSRDESYSRIADARTKPSSQVSSDVRITSKERNDGILDNYYLGNENKEKYPIGKESKETSFHDAYENIIYKLKRPLNINMGKNQGCNIPQEKDCFDLKYEAKNNRNIKRSILESHMTGTNTDREPPSKNYVVPRVKLNESRSLLLTTKDTSFLSTVSKNIENIKSRLTKKLEYNTIGSNLSTNTTNNVSNASGCSLNIGGLHKRASAKQTSFNIKSLFEMNNMSNATKI